MNKKTIFVFIVVSLFLIAGCKEGGLFGRGGDKRPITDIDVRKGIEGLNMEFTSNAPPLTVFEGIVFPIAVELRNQGASDIEATEVKYKDENDNIVTDTVDGVLVFGFETTFVSISFIELVEKFRELSSEKLDEFKEILKEAVTKFLELVLINESEELSDGEKTKIEELSDAYVVKLFEKELRKVSAFFR